jgi:uncharacterized membrane protein YbhN (UPF0104 family)
MAPPEASRQPTGGGVGAAPRPSRRRTLWSAVLLAAAAVALYVGLPEITGLKAGWGLLSSGAPLWLCAAGILEILSYAAYVFTLHRLLDGPGSRIGWHDSYDITMAGVAATRVFATAGVGGIALTAWAIHRSGMGAEEVGHRLTTFYVSLYSVFMAALVVFGAGLWTGVLAGRAPLGLTLVPACFAAATIAAALLTARLPADLDDRAGRSLSARPRVKRWLARITTVAATVAAGVRGALGLLRRGDRALLGALAVWTFDLGSLWACFHAFGEVPAFGVVALIYLAGQLGNVLPIPGGLGGVEGGAIGAALAFGVKGDLAVTVVLAYRVFDYWLPIVPGILAYLNLLRRVAVWDRTEESTSTQPAGRAV